MITPAWEIISGYGLPTPSFSAEPFDLALAEVNPQGVLHSISKLGKEHWSWKEGESVPLAVLEALKEVDEGVVQALVLQQDQLSLLGMRLNVERGWLLIGYEAENQGAESASTFRSLNEKIPVLILRLQADGTVVEADEEAETITGYGVEEIVGRPFWHEVVHPEDRWKLAEAFQHAGTGNKATVEVRFLTPRQELRVAQLYLLPSATDPEMEALVFDMTEQSEVEAMLMQSEAVYRTFLEQSPMAILHLDPDGVVTFENHPFRQIVGEAVEDAWIGRGIQHIAGLDSHFADRVSQMLQEGTAIQGHDVIYQRSRGRGAAYLVVHGSPIRQVDSRIVGGVMMIEDVTEQRQREEELRLRERYEKAEVTLREAVLHDLNEAAFLHEAASILGDTTQADRVHILTQLGGEGNFITRAAWVGDEQEEPFSLYARADDSALRSTVEQGENLHLHADSVPEEVAYLLELTGAQEVVWAPFYDAGALGGFVLFERTTVEEGLAQNWPITAERLMHRLVRLFETLWSWVQIGQRYRLTVSTIDDCLFTFSFARDVSRRYLFITPQIDALTGYRPEEILAHDEAGWSWAESLVHPEDVASFEEHEQALQNGRESRLTFRVIRRNGTERWLCEHGTPHRDAAGRITVSGMLMDVTDQKDAEEVLLSAREQVESASRLKSTFVATMSHELRTPLGAVNGFAELLKHEIDEWEEQNGQTLPPQVHEFAEAVRTNAQRLLSLADDLFILSNMEMGALRLERVAVHLHPLLQRCITKITRAITHKGVQLNVELAAEEMTVQGDPQRIEQVLDNVLSNAEKFTSEGHVSISTRQEQAEVIIKVADTGAGMDPDYLKKLFTPFLQEDSRLNRRFEGTGLGLALTKRLVDVMGGRITVESEKGKGSTFSIYLPLAAT